jgi:signal transduction histidine kinase
MANASLPHLHPFLGGGGPVGDHIRSMPWTDTRLGHPDGWPVSLQSSVSLCLCSEQPVCLYWGPDFCMLYNEAWSAIPGEHHPWAIGRPGREVWQDSWPQLHQHLSHVVRDGEPCRVNDEFLPLWRNGMREECYFTHHWSAIRAEDGGVGGVFNGFFDTTPNVLAQRRSRSLHQLSLTLFAPQDTDQVAEAAIRSLGSLSADLPFLGIYRPGPIAGQSFRLVATEGGDGAPAAIAGFLPQLTGCTAAGRPLLPHMATVPITGRALLSVLPAGTALMQLQASAGQPLPTNTRGIPLISALVVPIPGSSPGAAPCGYLVSGLNPMRPLDEPYAAFLASAALLIGAALDSNQQRIALVQKNEVQRLTLETGRFGTWTLEPNGVLELSQRAASLFGYTTTRRHWQLDRMLDRYHPEDQPSVRAAFQTAMTTGAELQFEARLRSVEQGECWLWVRGSASHDASGQISLAGLVGDVTARHRAETVMRETEKLAAAGRLAATIAHEINNPLESVTNLIYLAALDESLTPGTAQLLRAADAELGRVTHIARQTLGFYRDSLGPVAVDIHTVIVGLLKLYERRPDFRAARVDLSRVQHVSLSCLQGELRQVLSNLLMNAVQASAPGGRIALRAWASVHPSTGEPVLRVTVADEGSGISPENRDKLFSAFFTTKRDIGNGLGLWVSKGIMEKQNGSIRYRSRVGQRSGTCFMITLPILAVQNKS